MTKPVKKHIALRNFISRLTASESFDEDTIRKAQFKQLHIIVTHAEKYSPFIKQRIEQFKIDIKNQAPENYFYQLPILTRRDIQSAGERLFCREIPKQHQPTHITETSGSTGEPVKIKKTNLNHVYWLAYTFRENAWWQRNLMGRLAIIRADVPKTSNDNWVSPLNIFNKTGPSFTLPINTDIKEQIIWLQKNKPDYLLTYPSNLYEVIQELKRQNINLPSIKHIRTIGETLTAELRELTLDYFNAEIADTYSSQEVGYIAMQCPACLQYHVMAENLIVEILDNDDKPCLPGETGRVVVTDLNNTATPLIRYEIRDYAELGIPCEKRPGLMTLKKILGRERNMVVLPNGKRFWPRVGFAQYRDIADIKQYQLIQKEESLILVRLVVEPAISEEQEYKLTKIIQSALGYPFQLKFECYTEKLPAQKNGKFEIFVCEL